MLIAQVKPAAMQRRRKRRWRPVWCIAWAGSRGACHFLIFYCLFQEGSAEWKRCEAKVRRMVTPSKKTGNCSVSSEVLKRWDSKGGPRKDLIRMMVKCEGCKDSAIFSSVVLPYHWLNIIPPDSKPEALSGELEPLGGVCHPEREVQRVGSDLWVVH